MNNFTYNSNSEQLVMPEYGRNVQELVGHCKTIIDDKYRQSFAETIVDLMQIMTPYNKNMEEHRKKLWHHFFRIAKYDINIEPPTGVVPSPEEDILKPRTIPYPKTNERYRHYGNFINELIGKAMVMEAGPKRDEFSVLIGSFMKMAYKNWNKDHYINDELIKNDLRKISNNILSLDENVVLDSVVSAKHQKRSNIQIMNNNNNRNKQNKKKQKFKKKK